MKLQCNDSSKVGKEYALKNLYEDRDTLIGQSDVF